MDSVFTVTDRLAMVYNHQIAFTGTIDEAKTTSFRYLREFISGGRGVLGEDFDEDPETAEVEDAIIDHLLEENPPKKPAAD